MLIQDIRYGFRSFIKNPGFTIVAVLALALGIGATTVMFSVVNAVLLEPLPYAEPGRLMMVWLDNKPQNIHKDITSFPTFEDWRSRNQVFEKLAAYTAANLTLTGGAEPEQIRAAMTTGDFFPLFGVSPAAGRALLPEENSPGREQVVVLSDGLWKRRFGASPQALGQTLSLNGRPFQIVGIMPPQFRFPERSEIWIPLAPVGSLERQMRSRGNLWLSVIGRLKQGTTVAQAQGEMDVIARQLAEQQPNFNRDVGVFIEPLSEDVVGNVRPAMLVLFGAVCFVLLIACTNVANLLLSRAAARQREFALRVALGAARGRLIRQLLTESVLLSAASSLAGLLMAYWAIRAVVVLAPAGIPRIGEVHIDTTVLAFTILVSIVTGILFGIAPAVVASRRDVSDSMKSGGRGTSDSSGNRRLRNVLVVSELAVALLLLVGAALLMKSFVLLQSTDPGFNADRILTARVALSPLKHPQAQNILAFYDQLLERVRSLPNVQSADLASAILLGRLPNSSSVTIEGRDVGPVPDLFPVPYDSITPGFFQTAGIQLIRGRAFTEQDDSGAQPVTIINEAMAKRFWPAQDPLGKRLTFNDPQSPNATWQTVVGIVADVRRSGLDTAARPETYFPLRQSPIRSMQILVKTRVDPVSVAADLKNTVWSIDKDQPVAMVRTMESLVEESLASRRFNTLLLGIFSAIAVTMAIVGIYGVMSYSVTHRIPELGIRMALGAQPSDVLKLVLAEGGALTAAGIALGLLGSVLLTRLIANQLYGVSATDPATLAIVSLCLAAVALSASYIPARRATKIDTLETLRRNA